MAEKYDQGLDNILLALGPVGWFNVVQLILISIAKVPCGLQLLSNVFIGQHVPHRCAKPDNQSMELLLSPFHNYTNISVVYNQCDIQIKDNQTILLTESCLFGMDYDYPVHSSFRSEFGLVCEKTNLARMTQSLVIGGQALGAFMGSALSDRYGRKTVMIIGGFTLLISGLAIAYSSNFHMFAVFKFIVGVGQQTTLMGSVSLTSEIMTTKNRRFSFAFGGFMWGITIIFLDIFAVSMKDYPWRSLQLAISLVSTGVFLQIIFLKEPLRWLMANDKKQESISLVKHNAKLNGKNEDEMIQILESIWPKKSREQAIFCEEDKVLVGADAQVTPKPKTLHFYHVLKIPRILFHTIIIWFAWFSTALAYFALYLMSATLAGDKYLNFFLIALMEQPSNVFSYLFLNRIGRKFVFIVNFVIVGVGLIGSGIFRSLDPTSVHSTFALLFSLLSMIGVSGAFGMAYGYTLELYPTNIRSQSIGISSLVARFGGMLAPFTGLLSDHVEWGPGVVIGCLALVVALLLTLLPETRGRELPQTIEELQTWFRNQKHANNEVNKKNGVI